MTEHFSKKELMCRCGCGQIYLDKRFLNDLEDLRVAFGKPMIVTSGYRCEKYNEKVSSTGGSGPHTTGKAIDIRVSGQDAYTLVAMAINFGFSGIGVHQRGPVSKRYVHLDILDIVDNMPRPRIWSY